MNHFIETLSVNLQRITHLSVCRIINFRQTAGITIQTIIQRRCHLPVRIHRIPRLQKQFPDHGTTTSEFRENKTPFIRFYTNRMMINHRHFFHRHRCNITSLILAVHGNQNVMFRHFIHISNRNTKVLHHQFQRWLCNLMFPCINQIYLFTQIHKIRIQTKRSPHRVRIRTVMALYTNRIEFCKLFEKHKTPRLPLLCGLNCF